MRLPGPQPLLQLLTHRPSLCLVYCTLCRRKHRSFHLYCIIITFLLLSLSFLLVLLCTASPPGRATLPTTHRRTLPFTRPPTGPRRHHTAAGRSARNTETKGLTEGGHGHGWERCPTHTAHPVRPEPHTCAAKTVAPPGDHAKYAPTDASGRPCPTPPLLRTAHYPGTPLPRRSSLPHAAPQPPRQTSLTDLRTVHVTSMTLLFP